MAMQQKEVTAHFLGLDPHSDISKNTPTSEYLTVDYSGFKTICEMSDQENSNFEVRMADFKRPFYTIMTEVEKIVLNESMVIRLGLKDTFYEVYDTMFRNLDEDKIKKLDELFTTAKLHELGYELMVINYNSQQSDNDDTVVENTCMMMKYIPLTDTTNNFFGYII